MSTELEGRPVLRPAGNVARMRQGSKGDRGANARKPAKKPPFSPPLKPSHPAAVKISPPNSQPSTPRNALICKSPLLKPSAPPRQPPSHSPTKSSGSSAITKPCPGLPHRQQSWETRSAHADASPAENIAPCCMASKDTSNVCVASDGVEDVGSVLKLPERQLHVASGDELPSHQAPSFLALDKLIKDLDYTDDVLVSEELDAPARPHCVTPPSSHIAEPQTAPVESSNMQEKQNGTSISSSNRSKSSIKSPVVAAAQGKPKSCLTRSSSDNCRRSLTRSGKASSIGGGKNFNCLASSHSLDHASLAGLVAAKKAAALESSAQRKLKVAEYGRKPGKASRVAPEVPSLSPIVAEPSRCKFITTQSDPLLVAYHDQEWGTPVHDDRGLFELLVLAGAQVELSWTTILQKREAYRDAFCRYDPESVALFSERHIHSLEADSALSLPGGKIRGVVENARRILEVVKEFGSLDNYLWSFVSKKPMINNYRYAKQVPAKTSKSEFISKALVKRRFRFVGPTIVYSFMQAAGMTNDHLVQCFRHQECMNQPKSSQEAVDLKEYRVVEGDSTPSIQGDTDAASAMQLFCKHDTLSDPQGQQLMLTQAVHV